jgi:uncharacterized protein YeeX (DUF496 family)
VNVKCRAHNCATFGRPATRSGRSTLSQEAREIRMRLEEMQKGAGEVAGRVTELRELAGQASALRDLVKERTQRSAQITRDRRDVYKELDELGAQRSNAREDVARSLEDSLGSHISIVVSRSEVPPCHRALALGESLGRAATNSHAGAARAVWTESWR